MAFTVKDFHDLIRIIDQRPEWRGELRRVVLTEDLLALPEIVRELAESQKTLAARMDQLIQRMDQLVQRLDQLTHQLQGIAVTQHSLLERVGQLAEAQLKMGADVDRLKGKMIESQYRERAFAYFSPLVRGARTLAGEELFAMLSGAVDRGVISLDEEDAVMHADAVVRGKRRTDGAEVYLVVEVSLGVGTEDVQRAIDRAQTLSKLGLATVPVVAGDWLVPSAGAMAEAWKVWQVTDGHAVAPPE